MNHLSPHDASGRPGRPGLLRRLGVTLGTASLLAVAPAAVPAQAGVPDPVYSVTDVVRAAFHTTYLSGFPTCGGRDASGLTLHLRSAVENPSDRGDYVSVEGLKARVFSGTRALGTVRVRYGYLAPEHGPSSNFLEVGCRAWSKLKRKGFGAAKTGYGVALVGTGRAYDDTGAPAGTVETTSTRFPVQVKQLARYAGTTWRKVRKDVRVSTQLRAWTKRGDGHAWRAVKRTRVQLLRQTPAGRFRKVDTARTNKRGRVTLQFKPRRHNYVTLRVKKRRGYSISTAVFYVKRNGDASPMVR